MVKEAIGIFDPFFLAEILRQCAEPVKHSQERYKKGKTNQRILSRIPLERKS
jgi:hypothetical protein